MVRSVMVPKAMITIILDMIAVFAKSIVDIGIILLTSSGVGGETGVTPAPQGGRRDPFPGWANMVATSASGRGLPVRPGGIIDGMIRARIVRILGICEKMNIVVILMRGLQGGRTT